MYIICMLYVSMFYTYMLKSKKLSLNFNFVSRLSRSNICNYS